MELTQTIETERLRLRPLRADDAERMALIANDKRIARNLTHVFPHPYTLADAESFLAAPAGLAIDARQAVGSLDAGLIGVIGADAGSGENGDVLSFGYWLAAEAWGHGLATEAAGAFLADLASALQPRRFEALVYGWNPASGRVLEKLGFVLEGRCVQRITRFGEVTDELIYGKLL